MYYKELLEILQMTIGTSNQGEFKLYIKKNSNRSFLRKIVIDVKYPSEYTSEKRFFYYDTKTSYVFLEFMKENIKALSDIGFLNDVKINEKEISGSFLKSSSNKFEWTRAFSEEGYLRNLINKEKNRHELYKRI